jgi:hypothetical protein
MDNNTASPHGVGGGGKLPWEPIANAPRDGSLVWLRGEQYEPGQPFWFEKGKWQTILFATVGSGRGHWDESLDRITHFRRSLPTGGDDA